jgi:phosphoribosylanthranilate isomerase
MSVRVKICGLRDAETIRRLNGLAIDEIGFVFAESRRQVAPALAAELIKEVRLLHTASGQPLRTVGVFVNAGLEQLRELLAVVPLDVVQLHGAEAPELCCSIQSELGVNVWKVFSISGDECETALQRLEPYKDAVDAIMIDTAGGGTGTAFDWSIIGRYRDAAAAIGVPLYVAGGLHPDNVEELVRLYAPDGVDVSSGVETDGVKDIDKIYSFVGRVKGS